VFRVERRPGYAITVVLDDIEVATRLDPVNTGYLR
jgi:hypothetical protein